MLNPFDQDLQLKMARKHIDLFSKVVPENFLRLMDKVKDSTMLSIERLYDIYLTCKYLDKNQINGALLEIGTWKCGSLGMALISTENASRKIIGFDTCEGHYRPEANEVDIRGHNMRARWDETQQEGQRWAAADLEESRKFLQSLNQNNNPIALIKGDLKETLKDWVPEPLALIRIDCDWYLESKVSLEFLWKQLVSGGIAIMDDYGHHDGQRRAVDEFFADKNVKFTHVDYSCISILKI